MPDGVPDDDASLQHGVMADHPLEDVGEREEGEALVGVVQVEDGERRDDIARDVAMGQHHALRVASGAGGVDQRGHVIAFGRMGECFPVIVPRVCRGAACLEVRQRLDTVHDAIESDHEFQVGHFFPHGDDPFEQLLG